MVEVADAMEEVLVEVQTEVQTEVQGEVLGEDPIEFYEIHTNPHYTSKLRGS